MTRHQILERVDNWKFWMGVAYFGLCIVVVFLWILFSKTTRVDAEHAAFQRANDVQAVATCFQQVKTGPIVEGFVDSLVSIVDGSIASTRALIRDDPYSPASDIRRQSLSRLVRAREGIADLDMLVKEDAKTKADCVAIARESGVPYQRYLKELKK